MNETTSPPAGFFALDEKRFLTGYRVQAGQELLFVGGQVGLDAEGRFGESLAEQAELACANLLAVLRGAQMTAHDLVALRWFIVLHEPNRVSQAQLDSLKSARQAAQRKYFDSVKCPMTLLFVPSLYRVECLVEVEAVAARARSPKALQTADTEHVR